MEITSRASNPEVLVVCLASTAVRDLEAFIKITKEFYLVKILFLISIEILPALCFSKK